MLTSLIICLFFAKTSAQVEGDFWWLNTKLDKYRAGPTQPKFEDLSEFDTDESSKILFKDDEFLFEEENIKGLNIDEPVNDSDKTKITLKFEDKSEIVWPDKIKKISTQKPLTEKVTISSEIKSGTDKINKTGSDNDVLEFKFPDDNNFIWKEAPINNTNEKILPKKNDTLKVDSDKIYFFSQKTPIKVYEDVVDETENICTFIKKSECNRLGGVVYYKHEKLICCILPMQPESISSNIYFVESNKPYHRFKRSENDDRISSALKQRNTLLLRKFGSPINKASPITQRPSHKVVTPSDEYVDPYWNIKNSHFQNPNKKSHSTQQTSSRYDYYGSDDYVEDYVVELPTPGLLGLYSDHGPSKPAWSVPNTSPYGGVDSVEDEEAAFGYSPTVDPRLNNRLATTRPRISGRPVSLATTQFDDRTYDAETQTISYQSNPDFHVLQGFKLLNLVRNRSRIFRNGKKTTTEKILDDVSQEHVLTVSSLENDYDDDFDKKEQVHADCGRVVKGANRNYDIDKQIGDAQKGSHPSLALVVLTKKRQNILCYATIVHTRAAITAADCVYGRTSPGEIMLIAGAWHLNEEKQEQWQKRMASVHIHSQYKPGELVNNLAILYWTRPLRFAANVQPACLSDPHVGDYCMFFGWGGYDQAIRKQSKWQRAIILSPSTCSERISLKLMPSDAYCASVQSQGTVTGIGGPLLCEVGHRQSAVGVAVWRDYAVILLPAHQWTIKALRNLQLD